ncbi:Histone transcription regulator 3/CABIN1 [Gracilaria domingensis]|nr:Histone transcription regulator 3/CABIN1 [Gracilaria domingensis]
MLQQWATSNSAKKPPQSQVETPEQRENRLLTKYESALNAPSQAAKTALIEIVQNLSESRIQRLGKRNRPSTPLWERRLRYAVHRNLADVHVKLNEPDHALTNYSLALDDDNTDFLTWLKTARAAVETGRLHVARRAYEVALSMRPRHWLAQSNYQAVLCAVFDADEDVLRPSTEKLSPYISFCLSNRRKQLNAGKQVSETPSPERIVLLELSWAFLVDSLISCLESRLSSSASCNTYDVSHSIVFVIDERLRPTTSNSANDRDKDSVAIVPCSPEREVIDLVSTPKSEEPLAMQNDGKVPTKSSASNETPPESNDVSVTSIPARQIQAAPENAHQARPEGSSAASTGVHKATSNANGSTATEKTRQMKSTDTEEVSSSRKDPPSEQPKKPELRRSSRARNQQDGQDEERRLTRTATGAKDSTQMDVDLIRTLLDMWQDKVRHESSKGMDTNQGRTKDQASTCNNIVVDNANQKQHTCAWNTVIDERVEAKQVHEFVDAFPPNNSGPADLMVRTLDKLCEVQVAQYSSSLALLWSALRDRLQFHMPGSVSNAALVIEAMVLSGKKAGKAKERRFKEASRLLSQMAISFDIGRESTFLKLRLLWVRANLNECRGKMQMAFDSAAEALTLLKTLENEKSNQFIPAAAGPELSGYSYNSLRSIINERLSRLKTAGDLEKAEVELSKVAQGDKQAAIRTVSILAPSVNASIKALEYEEWDEDDLATEFSTAMEHKRWEERLEAEIELEPRLKIFGEACAKAADLVGELLCFSVRLRMAVHFYAAQLRDEVNQIDKPMNKMGSCEVRLADLLVLIRKYALVIKKVANPSSSDIWSMEEDVCGWSMEKATSVAQITLISLTKLLITKIPILKFSAPISELGASQKNKRLGFTRCMLAFVRCVLVNQYARMSPEIRSQGPESQKMRSLTRKRLFVTSYCLRALVDRGCCREEGTSGALMKLYSQFLAERLRQLAYVSRMKVSKPSELESQISNEMEDDSNRVHHGAGHSNKDVSVSDDASGRKSHKPSTSKEVDDADDANCEEKMKEREEDKTAEKEKTRSEKDMENEVTDKNMQNVEPARKSQTGRKESCAHEGGQLVEKEQEQAKNTKKGVEDEEADDEEEEDDTPISQIDSSYQWRNVTVIRRELAQSYQCLYQIPDLELSSTYSQGGPVDLWLEEGCRVSKHIGLQFTSGDPMNVVPVIDTEACCTVYFFYRKRIFEAIGQRRRDGGRGKKLREVLSRLAESLPETPPSNVHLLPFKALNEIVMDVISSQGDISRGAAENVTRLKEEWNRGLNSRTSMNISKRTQHVQLSVLYFEVFTLHALSTMGTHDVEYKKQKSAERRKSPKEVAERLISAYSDCLVALRSRPWSIGAWILLGRIFVETADLALDERELSLSSFGLYRSGDLATFDEKISSINAIFGRAEASFAFAESLLSHPWAQKAASDLLPINSTLVLGQAFQVEDEWDGFGDDGDLFGLFGLTNETTCRPRLTGEFHPSESSREVGSQRLAAIRFGSSALSILRLRELRYFHTHWTHSTLETRLLAHPKHRYPEEVVRLSSVALAQLREARKLSDVALNQAVEPPNADAGQTNPSNPEGVAPCTKQTSDVFAKPENAGVKKYLWYYVFQEAKLMRKEGRPASEYLPVFQLAVEENKKLREAARQPLDIEPIYKLHAARMKILRATEDNTNTTETLSLLEKYSFSSQARSNVDENQRKDDEDWVIEKKIAIAEDIILAMQFCANPKSEMVYSEFFFKATFCKSVLLVEVLKDTKTALSELDKLFGTDSALRALDQGPDGVYRGYFYRMWNYHYTDTGIEPALESERKLVRWRGKMLGLYGNLLKNVGEWRLLAAIISRLKRRNSEDLPVDGALLDDLIEAYAVTSRSSILTSMEKSIVTDPSAFEFSYRRTWDIYAESLRISQGMKRVGIGLSRGEMNETGGEQLLKSGRPKCLAAIHTALRLEHIRWKSAIENTVIDMNAMRALPSSGSLFSFPVLIRQRYLETLQESANKWPLEEKITKLLLRRMTELSPVETTAPPG